MIAKFLFYQIHLRPALPICGPPLTPLHRKEHWDPLDVVEILPVTSPYTQGPSEATSLMWILRGLEETALGAPSVDSPWNASLVDDSLAASQLLLGMQLLSLEATHPAGEADIDIIAQLPTARQLHTSGFLFDWRTLWIVWGHILEGGEILNNCSVMMESSPPPNPMVSSSLLQPLTQGFSAGVHFRIAEQASVTGTQVLFSIYWIRNSQGAAQVGAFLIAPQRFSTWFHKRTCSESLWAENTWCSQYCSSQLNLYLNKNPSLEFKKKKIISQPWKGYCGSVIPNSPVPYRNPAHGTLNCHLLARHSGSHL